MHFPPFIVEHYKYMQKEEIKKWQEYTYTQWSITQPLKRIHLNQF